MYGICHRLGQRAKGRENEETVLSSLLQIYYWGFSSSCHSSEWVFPHIKWEYFVYILTSLLCVCKWTGQWKALSQCRTMPTGMLYMGTKALRNSVWNHPFYGGCITQTSEDLLHLAGVNINVIFYQLTLVCLAFIYMKVYESSLRTENECLSKIRLFALFMHFFPIAAKQGPFS